MTEVFELAAVTAREGHEQALLDERPAMIAAMRRCPGVKLTRLAISRADAIRRLA